MSTNARSSASIAACVALLCVAGTPAQSYSRRNKLFNGAGVSGFYHSFRVPSIVRATGDVLLAFAEGRVGDADDWGNINLVYRRSTDNGKSWSSLREIAGRGLGGYKNPTTVYESPWPGHSRGRVHLFFNWHSGDLRSTGSAKHGDVHTFYTYSDDDGLTWARRRNLTPTLLPKSFGWDTVGPGAGIQKLVGGAGRVIVPATGRNFYSDDHGATWRYQMMSSTTVTGESTVAECLDGTLLRNDRAIRNKWEDEDKEGNKRRWVSYGRIPPVPLAPGGFPTPAPQDNLRDPRCHASLLRYNLPSPGRLIFLNSDSTESRLRMKVRISYDDGKTWPRDRWLYVKTDPDNHPDIDSAKDAGKGAYSAMTKTNDYHMAALVEVNEKFTDRYTYTDQLSIDFHRFNLAWILDEQPEPSCPELTNVVVGTLPNITNDPFKFNGNLLHLVTKVFFYRWRMRESPPITSQSSTWSGWFSVINTHRIEVYPPKGLPPGKYRVAVGTEQCISPPVDVSLHRNQTLVLVGSSRPDGGFEMVGSLGRNSAATTALLAVSSSDRPSVLPGSVNLGIGNRGWDLTFFGAAIRSNRATGVFRWRIPKMSGSRPWYFQAAFYDRAAARPLPMLVSNVASVRR